ncbi:hypothetical protein GIB67_008460 [Kingdonia uniflora]|uniref:Uncharacterized protein n=1 Tax=Kingdonia uniflora TaxID=39325 RepID=A0A7J7N559_9MAGN|nr:hypothetical protein GIB67_008460 [Kingdonia uniflora]
MLSFKKYQPTGNVSRCSCGRPFTLGVKEGSAPSLRGHKKDGFDDVFSFAYCPPRFQVSDYPSKQEKKYY